MTTTSHVPPALKRSLSSLRLRPQLFLGIDLAIDKVHATLIDAEMTVVDSVTVELDHCLPELQTQNGVLHLQNEDVAQPLSLVLAGLDTVLEILQSRHSLSLVTAISGSAHSGIALLSPDFSDRLDALDASSSFFNQLPAKKVFTTPNVSTSLSSATALHRLAFESALGGAQAMAETVGGRARFDSAAVQLMGLPWFTSGSVRSLGAFLQMLLSREPGSVKETRAWAAGTGLWGWKEGDWNAKAFEVVALKDKNTSLKDKLARVESVAGDEPSLVSRYASERFGFSQDCIVAPFLPDHLAAHLSQRPEADDAVLALGAVDVLSFPLKEARPSYEYQLYPHPAQKPGEAPRWIGAICSRVGDSARRHILERYADASWPVFHQLVSAVAPGGSIGFDGKLFSFVWPLSTIHPRGSARGIVRFETGVQQAEFRDLRANPRCVVESQALALRTRYSSVAATLATPSDSSVVFPPLRTALGLGFDPFASTALPKRLLLSGDPLGCPSIAGILADVFGSPVCVNPAQRSTGQSSAPALGAAYLARWTYRRTALQEGANSTFEEDANNSATPPIANGTTVRRARSSSSLAGGWSGSLVRSASKLNLLAVGEEPTTPTAPMTPATTAPNGNGHTIHGPANGHATPSAIAVPNGLPIATPQLPLPPAVSPSTSVEGATAPSSNSSGINSPPPVEEFGGHLRVATPDVDAWKAYASMLPEYSRLEELFVKHLLVS